jgi:hypothetical protein
MGVAVPAEGAYVPAGAGAQETAPGAEKAPARQLAQVVGDVAPNAVLKVPAGQLAQPADVCPGAGLYVPARQGAQSAAEAPPAASSVFPAGHSVQREEPGAGAKEPGGQPPQSSTVDPPLKGFSVPAGQARQEAALLAPGLGP